MKRELAFKFGSQEIPGFAADKILRQIAALRGKGGFESEALRGLIDTLTADELALGCAIGFGYPFLRVRPPMVSMTRLDISLGKECTCVFLEKIEKVQTVVMASPWDETARTTIERSLVGSQLIWAVGSYEDITISLRAAEEQNLARSVDSQASTQVPRFSSNFQETHEVAVGNNENEVLELFNEVAHQAVGRRATDLQFLQHKANLSCAVIYAPHRQIIKTFSPDQHKRLLGALRTRAKIDSNQDMRPQDGKWEISVNGRPVGVRIAIIPHNRRLQSIMLRLHDDEAVNLDLHALSLHPDVVALIEEEIEKPDGLMIVTGPTGSGKSSTLYACLKAIIDEGQWNVCTAEDPVEVSLDGCLQVEVNEAQGLTFEVILRSFLRYRPDVLLVGEMRDRVSADICLQLAMSGHQVFSTLHTRRALDVFTRLAENGVAPSIIAQCLSMVTAQRLVRPLCKDCRRPVRADPEFLAHNRLPPDWAQDSDLTLFNANPAGCSQCLFSGYGRVMGGLFRKSIPVVEVFTMTEPMRDLLVRLGPKATEEIRAVARAGKMVRLGDRGLELLKDGIIDLKNYNGLREDDN